MVKVYLIKGSEILDASLVYLISVHEITGLGGISIGLFFLRWIDDTVIFSRHLCILSLGSIHDESFIIFIGNPI